MPLTEAAKAKKKKRDDEAHQQAAKSIVNKTVKAADHANKAVSNNTRQPSVSQKTQSTVERLNQKYGRNQSQPSVSTVKKPSQTSPKTQKTVDRLNEKYGKGKVTGGKHSYMDDVADTAKSTLRQVAAEEARAFNASARTLTSKDSYLYASQAEIDAANKRADERDKKFRAKIKQESAEMEKLKQGHSYLGQQGLSAVSSAVGMATDAAWGPAALAHMFIRTQAGSEGNVKEKVEPLKQKLSASGNYSQEEIDEMFKDVDKWDLANSVFEGGIEVLSEKMFGGFGLAKKVGGSGILDKSLAKLGARMGSKATTGVLGRVARGTAEEVAEEEIGNPLQTLASNLIYGNRMQNINEDATRRELQAQSDAIRSRIQTPEDAQAVATQLGSKEFMADSRAMYLESGMSEKEADELANMTRDYLEAAALGDTDKMRDLQDKMVKKLAGGENSLKEKWTLQDAIDAAVSTSLMTVTTGAPGAVTNSMMGKSYKDTNGMDAVKNLAKVTKNLDPEKSVRAQAIMDRIDAGEDISGTQVYDLIQWSSEAATESYKREDVKERMADSVMKRENLFVAPSVRNEDGSVTLGEETERRYDEILEENKAKAKAVQGISREDAEIAADVATAFQLGTITANQMNELSSDNLEVREAFHQITGINLNQFDTSANPAENNIAMQESLFARAADNYIESARIEQEAWNDGARGEVESSITEGLGSNGDVAVHDALNSVDPRDRSTFILMGRASASVYDYARFSEDSWEDVRERLKSMYPSLPQEALKGVYEGAKRDKKIAETPYYNAKVKANESARKFDMSEAEQTEFGKFTNEAQRQLKDSEQIVLQSLAQQFNINIKLLPSKAFKTKSEGKNGKTKLSYTNGAYNPKTRTMFLNGGNDMERNLIAVALHEITHHIATYAPDEYIKLSNRVMDRWYKNDPDAFKEAIQQKQAEYKKAVKQDLSEEQALEEIIADAVGEMNSDRNFIEQICREKPTLAEKIINAIKDVLRKLRQILSSGRISEEYEDAFFAQLDMWDEAQRLWMQAAKVAQQQRANKAIDDWDAQARIETTEETTTRFSITEDSSGKELTEGQKEYFKDSKIVDAEGRLKVMYHGTPNMGFTVFDRRKTRPGTLGRGFYFSDQDSHAGQYGARYEVYLNITQPLATDTNDITKDQLKAFVEEIAEDEDYGLDNYGYEATVDSVVDDVWGKSDFRMMQDINLACVGDMAEAVKLFNSVNGTNYDGIVTDLETVAFYPEQIKNIDNENPTEDPDIRYSATTDKEDFIKGANLSKELREWANEIGLDKLSKQPVKGPVIVSVRDLRTAWYQKNGRAEEAEVINTALDKIGDSLTQLVGKYQYIDLGDALNAAVTYRTDAEGHPTSVILSCQVKNAEYEVNFDFTTICAKRLAMQKILERFIKTEGERQGTTLYDELKLDEEGLYKLRLILETAGFDVSCRGCFVEQNRYSQQNQARTIANDWNAALDEWAKDNGTEVTENFGLTTLDIDSLDYEEIEAGFERYHELMKGKKTDVATKNRMLIEASPFFRKRMNASDYASMSGQRALMAIGESKKGGTNLYGLLKRGQSDSKQSVPFTAYNGEISLLPDNMKGKSLYDYLLSIGGARAQSASDFQIEFVYDYMQMVADLSARGLPMHMYTKVIELAELFGMTGIKINLSAMCDVADDLGGEYAGLKLVDGKYEYNISDQSIDYPKAVKLQKKDGYSKNIGIIMVTLSSQHMLKSLDDPDVRYIIGYHSSAMPVVVANMSNMGGATDYTKINKTNKLNEKGKALFDEAMKEAKGKTALEKYKNALRIFDEKIQEETAKKKKKPRRGNEYGAYMSAYGNNTADFNTYDSLLETKDARKTADKYLEHCMKNDLIPIYFPFAFHENYYKCEVYDFNMYDNNTGEYAPMESVQNIYPGLNMAAGETDTTAFTIRVSEMMDEQNRVNQSLDSQYDAVFDEAKDTLKFSITGDDYMDFDASGIEHSELTHRADAIKTEAQLRDEAYMDAVNNGNMEEAQRLVDEAAKGAGFKPVHRYHGTMNAGFTVFDKAYAKVGGNSGAGFYFSTEEDDSVNHYADVEGADNYFKWSSLAEHIWDQINAGEWEGPEFESYEDVVEFAKNELNKDPGTYDVYLNYKNPYIRDGANSTNLYDMLTDEFDESAIDRADYEDDWEYDDAVWDARSEHVGEAIYSAVYGAYQDMENNYEILDMPTIDEVIRRISEYAFDGSLTWKEIEDAIISAGGVEVTNPDWTDSGDATPEFTRAIIENLGFDAIEDKEVSKKFGQLSREMMTDTEHIIVFKPEQIKLSDPVTYREDGSVIPLSERFDPSNDDVRYSLPTQDSDGNILSDGQMEFFKNSQARDEQGRLIPMYHVTPIGGFTIFDPSYSFDETSISFSNDIDFALNYSSEDGNPDDWRTAAETRLGDEETEDDVLGHYKVYLNMENPLILEGDYLDEMSIYEWPAYAKDNGYDGVIYKEFEDEADIYQVFSGRQIKDTRNTEPSENPDIRFSITNDDEAMSKAAESDAWDNSVEALAYYESMIIEQEEAERYAKSLDEEKMNEFYAGLTAFADGMRFEDPVLEEGRVRLAKSKNDFMDRLNAEWNENWLTEGEVLDIKSVKAQVRQLVMSVMRNSDTDKQFKTDVVNKTLIDIRLAYQFAKKGRIDVADALIWHSALRMIENVEFVQDDTFKDYKDLRDYLRSTRISLGPEYWSDVNFGQFRKDNFGRLKLVKGDTNVDDIYMELSERWPEWFDSEEEMTPPDMLEQIAHVLDVIKPYKEAYSSEAAAEIATDIAYDLSDIVYGKGKPYESIADKYKNRYDAKAKAMKQRHEEALRKVKEQRDKGIKAERAKWHVREEQRKERTLHKRYYDSITRSYNKLYERLTTNTKDKHIPEQYKRDLAELLSAFDLQTVASKKVEKRRGVPGKKTIKMSAIRTVLKNIASKNQLFYINDTITDIMEELLGDHADGSYSRSIEGISVDELNSEELKKIDKLLKSLIHEFNVYESVRVGAKRQQAADIGSAQVDSCLAHSEKFGEGKDYQNFLGALDKVLNLDELTPAYLFRQIDPSGNGLGIMFRELRRSFDKYIRNQNQLNEWMNDILGQYHNKGKAWNKYGASSIEEWRSEKNAVEIHLANGTITVTPAQIMSIYCLQKRQQAYSHMTGAGVVIQPVSFQAKMTSDLLKKANYALPVILTDDDIKLIVSKLTKEQVDVADKLQNLMADKMAAWGNEASMAVLGIRLFEDPDYFPIKSDKAALEKDFSAEQFVEAIRNFGFTKAVQPGARNAIAVGDIFDVVAEHCNNMNLYNAYSEAMNDFMKVYNYHEYKEDGSDYSVEQAIAHAYSRKATTFIMTFMKDLNGNVSRERTTGIEAMMNDSLGKAKKASVFANGRVALQQPTALTRAFYVISPKYMNLKISKASLQEMFDHCPIALWKSWGYYDINMGKSIEDLMMNNGKWLDDKFSNIYGQLDNRTWAVIWNMCKAETEDLHPELKKGTEEYWEAVNARMTEVVDLTQVVDSPFHRSHAMRSKNTLVKMATAFMAEPTLTFNMVRDGLRRAHEAYKSGNKVEAGKIAGKTARIFVLSAFTTAAFAAVWDVIRAMGKGDDDEDKNVFDLWWTECMENLKSNINLLNNIYYVKDLVSLFQGWDQKNIGLQGWKHLADSYRQLTGSYKGYSSMSWWQNALAGVGYLTGIPIKTMMNDGKAIMNIFGIHPRVLDDIADHLDSIQDMLSGQSAGAGVSKVSSSKGSSKKSDKKSEDKGSFVNLWTYDNAPFFVEDGSVADKFLNHFGVNLTAAEIKALEDEEHQREIEKKIADIQEKTADLSGEAKDKKVWSYVTTYLKAENEDKSLSDFIEKGDYRTVNEYRDMYLAAGGREEYFDSRIFASSKKALKLSIISDPTNAQIEQQNRIKDYLLTNGMTEAEMSEIAYQSNTARDLKAAFRLNDRDAMVEELIPLVRAGLTYQDLEKLYKYRNSGRASYDGKYKDRFKSTGHYNWPITGQITSNFGHRSSPGGIGSTYHQGLDIAGSMGDPVGAADGGTVVYAGWYGGAGKTVMIEHDDGTVTQYSHLSWYDAKVGDVVGQGQTVGNVGSTGNSTGPHLHFAVKVNGKYVDPITYLND